MNFLKLFLLCSLVIASTELFARGNEGRGTEDSVLLGIFEKRKLSEKGLKYFEIRKGILKDKLLSKSTQQHVANFFRQIDVSKLSEPKAYEKDIRPLYKKLQESGAAGAIESSKVIISEKCIDENGVERIATTKPIPGSDICVDLERLTLLDLAMEFEYLEIYNLGFVYDFATLFLVEKDMREIFPSLINYRFYFYLFNRNSWISFSKNPSVQGLLFGVLMHEAARQFNEDDDHEFLYAMREQMNEHFVNIERTVSEQIRVGPSQYTDITCRLIQYSDDHAKASCEEYLGGAVSLYSLQLAVDRTKGKSITFKAQLKPGAPRDCLSEIRVVALRKGASAWKQFWESTEYLVHESDLKISSNGREGQFVFKIKDSHLKKDIAPTVFVRVKKNFDKYKCGPMTQLKVLDESGREVSSVDMDKPFHKGEAHRSRGFRSYNLRFESW